ncbi:hypothetical protein ACIQVE_02000 [Pseudomonas sp. NPDC098747]|uniref:hypothetical protein n=1 Tax=Pseudomonas sp. NPDC098747 TaxID=3364487 RepID=UPI00383A9B36
MAQNKSDIYVLLRQHETNLKLLSEHSDSWQGEDRIRGLATIANITKQTESLASKLKLKKATE